MTTDSPCSEPEPSWPCPDLTRLVRAIHDLSSLPPSKTWMARMKRAMTQYAAQPPLTRLEP